MVEDAAGFIWLGTPSGLLRYDGYRFQLFRSTADDSQTVAGNFIRALYADEMGRVWVGSEPGGLSVYVPEQDHFIRLSQTPENLFLGRVTSLAGAGDNGVWLGTSEGVFKVVLNASNAFQVEALPHGELNNVRALANHTEHTLWVGTNTGLYAVQSSQIQPVLPNVSVRTLYVARETPLTHQLFVGTEGAGAFSVEPETQEVSPLTHIPTRDTIYAFGEPFNGELWVAYHGAVARLNATSLERTGTLTHDPSNPFSLANNDIRALLKDSAGQFWVAGYGGGVQRLQSGSGAMATLRFSLMAEYALSDPNVSSVSELDSGDIWIGTRGKGIARWQRGSGNITPIQLDIPEGWISALAQDQQGWVWVGANPSSLYRVDPHSLAHQPVPFWNASVRKLMTTAKGRVWVATGRGVGVWR